MNKYLLNIKYRATVIFLGILLFPTLAVPVLAYNADDGIYMTSAYQGKSGYYPNGFSSHVYNKYRDSLELCKYFLQLSSNEDFLLREKASQDPIVNEQLLKNPVVDSCLSSTYTDERNFVGVNRLYNASKNVLNPDYEYIVKTYQSRQMAYYLNHDKLANENDIFQAKIYVHDNAGTDPKDIIRNTGVKILLEGNKIIAKVGNDTIYSTAIATTTLQATDELRFAESKDYPTQIKLVGQPLSELGNYIIYRPSSTDPITLKSNVGPKTYRDLSTSEYTISSDRKSFDFKKGDQIGSFPYSYAIVLDLVVKKKQSTQYTCTDRVNGVAGAGPRLTGETCIPGSTQYVNGKTVTCNSQCMVSTGNLCEDRILGIGNAGGRLSTDVCLPGATRQVDGITETCSTACNWTPREETCTDIYYRNQTEFRNRGYECITSNGLADGACTGHQTIVKDGKSYGPCKLIPDNKPECTTCACVEVDSDTPYAGDYQDINYTVTVSNQTMSALGANIEVRSRKADESFGYQKTTYIDNNRMNGPLTEDSKEGEVRLTDDAQKITFYVSKRSPRRTSDPVYRNIPDPEVDFASVQRFVKDPQNEPILVKNLVPGSTAGTITNKNDGDEVIIKIPAKVRTTQSATDKYGRSYTPLATSTQFVDYLFFMKSQTNGGMRNIALSKPYFQTYNAGDVFTSLAVTGIVNARELLSRDASTSPTALSLMSTFNEVSGFLFDTASTSQSFNASQKFDNISYSTTFKDDLSKNITKVTGGVTSSFHSSQVAITRESDVNAMNFATRPDGERIYTYDVPNGVVTMGTGGIPLSLMERTTLILKNGDLHILSNIQYGENQTGKVPAFAVIVQNGSIKIDPSVSRIDGVYVANNFSGTDDWKTYYESGKSSQPLTVYGSLLGLIDELIASRPFVKSPTEDGSAIRVNYDGRMIATPPPGLREILGGTFEKLKQ